MSKLLILFAHPALEHSRIQRELIRGLDSRPGVTFRDLYQLYPDFYVDVAAEQEQLLLHDTIIWQHPLYWYSVPPLLKQWIDLVFQHGWAYGERGVFLRGKRIMNVVSAGGAREAYCSRGYNTYTIRDFLRPLEQTARLCGMDYLPPYVIHGTHRLRGEAIGRERRTYHRFVDGLLADRYASGDLRDLEYANGILDPSKTVDHE
jgi:glutathione-regulated potassium-efflux system ancillary protein KefG